MSTILKRVQRMLFIAVAGALGLSMFAPIVALSAYTSGDTAFVSTGGGNATVRSGPSTETDAIGSIPNGTQVFIVDGPLTGDDGGSWYQAEVWDITGFISASLLGDSPQADTSSAPSSDSSSSIPWRDPIDYGVVVDNAAAPLPSEGLACRADADINANVITRFSQGATIQITDSKVWVGDIAFFPVNCDGQGGYVRADYIALQSDQSSSEPVADTSSDETASDAPIAEPDAAAPVAGDLIVTVLDQNGNVVPGVCFDLYDASGWIASACDGNDAVPNNGNNGFFGLAEGGYTLVASSVPNDIAIANYEAWVTAGQTSYATVSVTVPEIPVAPSADDTPSEDSASDDSTTDTPTDDTANADTPVDVPADDSASDDSTADIPTDDTANADTPVDVPADDSASDDSTADTPTDDTANADTSVDVPADDSASDDSTADTPTDDTANADTPVDVPADDSASDDSTADTPTDDTAIAGPIGHDVTPEPTTLDLSGALGDATVTGTNGEGVRCRISPDPNSATIMVLPEGITVFVLENPVDGFLGVACGNQLGYVDINYMWAGGAGDDIPASANSVVVVGTGGQRLNCRSGAGSAYSVLTSVPMGSVLTARGASSNGWAPVVCNGQNGFVSNNFVEVASSGAGAGGQTTTTPATTITSGNGTISGLGGDRLRCRTSAGTSGSIITMLSEGTIVTVRGAANNGWTPIVCAGQNGFVASTYIVLSTGNSNGGNTGGSSSGDANSGSGYVKISGTGGAALNCRTAASMSGIVITAVSEGTTLETRGGATDGWVPVVCGGRNGYVSGSFVTSTAAPAPGNGNPSGNGGDSTNPSPTTGTATVSGTEGTGVRCRVEPNGSIITTVAEGASVGTRGAASNGWTPVVCGGRDGYISSAYLTAGGSNPTPAPNPPTPGAFAAGDHVRVTTRTNLRYSPGGNIVIVVPNDTVVEIKGGPTEGTYQIDWDGLGGYLIQDTLVKTSDALSERGGSANEPNPAPNPGTGSSGSSATGNAMVNYAMRYIGYPYIWATHGPSSFDCSGFTYWVTKNVIGADIGAGLWTQWASGSAVSRENLQPGDLVFFQNTYKAGVSHVGIYIGNNQFVHAENENTGVRISDLNSNYYGSRWFGARRLA